jgi:hypothetical protein
LTQSSRIPDPADGFKLEEFISAAREKLIMRALNNGISSDTARYSKVTFDYLIVPYTLFAVGSGLKALFIGTGRPFYIFVPSAIVNLLIYMPLGLAAKYLGVKIRYTEFLQATIAVFLLDFILSGRSSWLEGIQTPAESSREPGCREQVTRPSDPRG